MSKSNEQMQTLRVNSIVEGTKLKGEINSPGNFRIDGEVDGNMKIEGKLIIGAKGVVKGQVMCKDAEIEGRFDGQLSVNGLLSLKTTSEITGDAVFTRLMVAEGAKLTCTCNLKQPSTSTAKSTDTVAASASPKAPDTRASEKTSERGMSAIR